MRIAVVSDSHGSWREAEQALAALKPLDLLLFAGDYYRDPWSWAQREKVRVAAVIGNCDWGARGPEEELLELGGTRILLTHGHRYGAKWGLERLFFRGLEAGAKAVVFGHTHVPVATYGEGGLLLFNPGSPSHPRGGNGGSIGLLEVERGLITPRLYKIDELKARRAGQSAAKIHFDDRDEMSYNI